jgi:hypothetical protein
MRGTAVLRYGVLRGMQHEESCRVLVHMREPGAETIFTEGVVFGAPPSLPDGEYLVHFEGHIMFAKKDGGRWVYSNRIQRQ